LRNTQYNFIRSDEYAGREPILGKKAIYRIMRFDELEKILRQRTLTLRDPKEWGDPFEGIILKALPNYQNDNQEAQDNHAYYGQCWSCKRSRDELWRLYSPEHNRAQIKTTITNLYLAIRQAEGERIHKSLFFGYIEYVAKRKLLDKLNNADFRRYKDAKRAASFFIKLNHFRYEGEARIIYHKENDKQNECESLKICDPHKLIQKIVFDPRINDDEFECNKNKLIELGYDKKRIIKSKLYDIKSFLEQANQNPQGGDNEVIH
jgi:hypothetical protein